MIDQSFINKAIKQVAEMKELDDALEASDKLSLEALEFVIEWYKNKDKVK